MVESPAKSIGARLYPDETNQGKLGIGPGGYNITSPKKNSYAYSMAGRLEDIEKKKQLFVPGPGVYEPKPIASGVQNRFGKSRRSELDTLAGKCPGPNQYKLPNLIGNDTPASSFGTEKRTVDYELGKVPGPGCYPIKPIMGGGLKITMNGKSNWDPEKREQLTKPGPGSYASDRGKVLGRAAAYSLGTESRNDVISAKIRAFQTSPDKYEPSMSLTQVNAPHYRFGSGMRSATVNKANKIVPGPGKYPMPSDRQIGGTGPAISMGSKNALFDMSISKTPGPGSYELHNKDNIRLAGGPSVSLGRERRSSLAGDTKKNKSPGPGQYPIVSRDKSPKYGFGSASRPSITGPQTVNVPGPGSYAIPS